MKRAAVIGISLGLVLGAIGAAQSPGELMAQGDRLYDQWQGGFEFTAYEARLRGALALWEQALAALPAGETTLRSQVLTRLSRGYFELADAYLTTAKDKEEAYRKGKDQALAALRLDAEFLRVERDQGFRAALGMAGDAAALFWYGNNLGRWLSYNWFQALAGGARDVLAAFTRAVELDEAYWGGGPRRALGNFLAQTPGFLGGDLEAAGQHFARAIELDPQFIQNYVDYAEVYAKPRGERDLFCRLLRTASDLGANPTSMAKWPLYNTLTMARVQNLLGTAPGSTWCW